MINIRVLQKSDNRALFSCGEIELDYFFQKFAGQNQFKHFVGTTYISTDNKNIFGFITVSAGSLTREELPRKLQKKLPKYPLPILRITRIGVDIKYQNRGLGKELIATAFRLAVEQKNRFGCIGIVVDAKVDAVDFYKKLGFIEIELERGLSATHHRLIPMFIVIQTIEKVL